MKKVFLLAALASLMCACNLFTPKPDTPKPDDPNPSDTVSTDTIPGVQKIDSMQMVDLGLSVKWAGYNLGAESPEQSGLFYAWGEAESRGDSVYYPGYYRFGNNQYMYKYVMNSQVGFLGYTDGRSQLMACDDAAQAAWGGNWRMPTADEKRELLRNTERQIGEYKGVSGYIFTSKINKHSIFFPFTGNWIGNELVRPEDMVAFWTSSLCASDNMSAYVCCNIISGSTILEQGGFDMDANADSYNLSMPRYMGLTIRPVYGEPLADEPYTATVSGPTGLSASSATFRVTVSGGTADELGIFWTGALEEVYPEVIVSVADKAVADSEGTVTLAFSHYHAGASNMRARAYAIVNGVVYYGNTIGFDVPNE